MNIFADLHHGDLYYSLYLLFEKRLGHKLFRPIGMEWFHEGYWKIGDPYPNPVDTAMQYLGIKGYKGEFPTNAKYYVEDGIYYAYQDHQGFYQKAVTFDKFKDMDFDVIISSVPAHDSPYAELIRKEKPSAKHIAQIGNITQQSTVKNIMASTLGVRPKPGQNTVIYHQEFDLDTFNYTEPKLDKKVTSCVHLLPNPQVYYKYKDALPEFEFKAYGASAPDGYASELRELAEIMRNSLFGIHIKPHGDGYGHIIHNWFAIGRPPIIMGSDYKGKMAEKLFIDGETCIDLDKRDFKDNVKLIREIANNSERYKRMCEACHNRFKEVVDFNQEEVAIRRFLEALK